MGKTGTVTCMRPDLRIIAKYLVRKFAKNDSLYPEEFMKRLEVDKMLDYDLGTLFRRATDYFIPLLTMRKYDETRKPKLEEALSVLNIFLKNSSSGWVVEGNFTIADLSILTTISSLEVTGYDISKYNSITEWLPKAKSKIPNYQIDGVNGEIAFKKMIDAYLA